MPLPEIDGLVRPTAPGHSFDTSDVKLSEVQKSLHKVLYYSLSALVQISLVQ